MFLQLCPKINPLGCPCSCPTPGCLWCWTLPWTWPRWSWRSGNILIQPSFSSPTAFANTTLSRNQFLELSLLSSYSWQSLVSGPHPDGPGCPEKVEINPSKHPKQLLFQQLCSKINPWCCPCSRPTPGSLWCLDLTQMVLAVRKKLKSTHLNIPNNFCFNNFAQKSIPGVVLAHGLLLAVFGVWTSPRWSWLSGKSWNQPT